MLTAMMRGTEADDDDVFSVFNLTSPIAYEGRMPGGWWESEAGADVGERADWMTGGVGGRA